MYSEIDLLNPSISTIALCGLVSPTKLVRANDTLAPSATNSCISGIEYAYCVAVGLSPNNEYTT